MQPLSLTLKGFRGIRDGLGLDALTLDFERLADGAGLVAIAGANGRGKTTVMDSMTPFLTMPSRAALAGPGGFSYYDHVCLPENEKDLTWAHEGRSYRSQVVIRLNGRRRTEAFLFVLDDAGRWQPMRLDDGTLSDGKAETYTRCVEAICGSADTFFTSVFSAQGKRQLSTYRNAEIKTLLADLLGQEEIRALGQKAAETARLFKAGLAAVRQQLTGLDEESARIAAERLRLIGAAQQVAPALRAKESAQAALEASRTTHARLAAQREQARVVETRRGQLLDERKALTDADARLVGALDLQAQGEQRRLERLQQRITQRSNQERARLQGLQNKRQQCLRTLAGAEAVQRAGLRLALAERVLLMRQSRITACRQRVQQLAQCDSDIRLASNRLDGIEREAGKAVLKAEELAHRFGLTSEVPCAGTDLQGLCKLLVDAREAQALIPSAKGQISRLAEQRAQVLRDLAALRQQRVAVAEAPQALTWADHRCELARERASCLGALAAKRDEMTQARATLIDIDGELGTLVQAGAAGPATETADERAERQQIAAARQAIAGQIEHQAKQYRASQARLADALATLPAAFDGRQLEAAAQAMKQAAAAVATAEASHLSAMRDAQSLEALNQQAKDLAIRRGGVAARVATIETELGGWNLFARCMSNDGLIALAIDDAGPTLASLANDLLLACYGPRFTVSVHTLVETGKGEQKEGFDIIVHDGDAGESKSMGLMSGGERVVINEVLVRAVALYLAQHSGRRYTTLFSDEVDGALDVERKRMFMAMKREVLRLGGYEREFFISQTPELTAMADAVIDLDALHANLPVPQGLESA